MESLITNRILSNFKVPLPKILANYEKKKWLQSGEAQQTTSQSSDRSGHYQ